MASSAAALKNWAAAELSKLLGFDEVDEIATYVLQIETKQELTSYMMDLLGDEATAAHFSQELIEQRKSPSLISSQSTPPVSQTQSTRGRQRLKETTTSEDSGFFGTGTGAQTNAGASSSRASTLGEIYIKPTDAADGQAHRRRGNEFTAADDTRSGGNIKRSGKSLTVTTKSAGNSVTNRSRGAAVSSLAPSKGGNSRNLSEAVVNCLSCGKIEYDAEWKTCTWCGSPLDDPIFQKSRISKPVTGAAGGNDTAGQNTSLSPAKKPAISDEEALLKAINHKEKLLDYDRNAAKRTQVFDDQSDYYSNSSWMSEGEREAAKKRDEARRDAMKGQRNSTRIAIDFAGRRVVVDQDSTSGQNDQVADNLSSDKEGGEFSAVISKSEESQWPTSAPASGRVYKNATLHGRASEVYQSLTNTLRERLEKAQEEKQKQGSAAKQGLERKIATQQDEVKGLYSIWSSPLVLSGGRVQHELEDNQDVDGAKENVPWQWNSSSQSTSIDSGMQGLTIDASSEKKNRPQLDRAPGRVNGRKSSDHAKVQSKTPSQSPGKGSKPQGLASNEDLVEKKAAPAKNSGQIRKQHREPGEAKAVSTASAAPEARRGGRGPSRGGRGRSRPPKGRGGGSRDAGP